MIPRKNRSTIKEGIRSELIKAGIPKDKHRYIIDTLIKIYGLGYETGFKEGVENLRSETIKVADEILHKDKTF